MSSLSSFGKLIRTRQLKISTIETVNYAWNQEFKLLFADQFIIHSKCWLIAWIKFALIPNPNSIRLLSDFFQIKWIRAHLMPPTLRIIRFSPSISIIAAIPSTYTSSSVLADGSLIRFDDVARGKSLPFFTRVQWLL